MFILNDSKMAPGFMVGRVAPHKNSATFLVKGTFRLQPGKPAVLDVKTQLTPHPMFGVMAQVVFQGVPLSMPDGPSPGA